MIKEETYKISYVLSYLKRKKREIVRKYKEMSKTKENSSFYWVMLRKYVAQIEILDVMIKELE